jgi:hypothetical protein
MSTCELGVGAEFLARHRLTEEDLYDACGAPPRIYGPEMKLSGKRAAYNVTPCRRCGGRSDRAMAHVCTAIRPHSTSAADDSIAGASTSADLNSSKC